MTDNVKITDEDKKHIEHLNSLGNGFAYMAEEAQNKMNHYKDSDSVSEEEYRSKREEVISRFRKEFFANYFTHNPKFSAVVQLLIRGDDPYSIIEQLTANGRNPFATTINVINANQLRHIPCRK